MDGLADRHRRHEVISHNSERVVSLGGDSDTLACITGGIAEAVFGIPKKIYTVGMNILKYYFPEPHKLVTEFENKYGNRILQ